MSLRELLKQPSTLPAWRGTWARIWMKPSVFSAQGFIVGLTVYDARGLCDFRLITGTDKFGCVYGQQGRAHVDQLLDAARQSLFAAREHHAPLSAIALPAGFHFDPVGYASGASPLDALESALNDVEMPMEPSAEVPRGSRFRSRTPHDVTAAVINAVKLKLGARAEQILKEDHFADEHHAASVNLVTPSTAGIIASGWYSSADRVQLELLKAVTTVEGYSVSHAKSGRAGIFFLRPTAASGLRIDQATAIEGALDQVDWVLNRKGLRVAVRDRESDLADDIAEWVAT